MSASTCKANGMYFVGFKKTKVITKRTLWCRWIVPAANWNGELSLSIFLKRETAEINAQAHGIANNQSKQKERRTKDNQRKPRVGSVVS